MDLSTFGLTDIESRIYLKILNSNGITANEIRRLCSVSKPTTYSVLRGLVEVSLIEHDERTPKRYFVRDPKIFAELKEKRLSDLIKKSESAIKQITKIYEEKQDMHCHGMQEFMLGKIYTQKNSALQEILALITNSKKEVFISNLPVSFIHRTKPSLDEAKNRGVSIRIEISDDEFIPKQLKELDFEISSANPMKPFFLVDGRQFNDGKIFIDREIMGNVFHGDDNIIFQYLRSPRCIECILRDIFHHKECKRKIPRLREDIPKDTTLVMNALKEKTLSKREISKVTGLSGGKVKKAVDYLIGKKKVSVRKVKTKRKPREEVYLINPE